MKSLFLYNLITDCVYPFINFYVKIKNDHVRIGKGAKVWYNSNLEGYNKIERSAHFVGYLGKFSYIGANSLVVGKVGRFCSISGNVTFLTQTHPFRDWISTHPAFYSLKKQSGRTFAKKQMFEESPILAGSNYSIEVGNDVYIGYGATIIGPVKIGNGAIIGANAVVSKDVPPYAIVAGNPAVVIRKRFSEEQIAFIEKSQWWNNDISWLEENSKNFDSFEHFQDAININV